MNVAGVSLPPPPRKVVLSGDGWVARITVWLVIPAVLFCMGVLFVPDFLEMQDLLANGRPVTAKVIGKTTQLFRQPGSTRNPARRGFQPHYWITYEAQGHRREESVSESTYNGLDVGDSVSITADPWDPAISRLQPVTRDQAQSRAPYVYFVILLIPVWFAAAYFVEKKISAQTELLSLGIECPATITRVLRGSGSPTLLFDYTLPNGSEARGDSSPPNSRSFESGQRATVTYYEPDSKRSTLIDAITWVKLK